MLEQLASLEQVYALCQDDPVRPHIPADQRLQPGKDVFVLRDDEANITAVICVAYTNEVPKCEKDMSTPGLDVAVFYTVWSYNKGAGREIIMQALDLVKSQKPMVERYVTLSPLTQTATRFHQRNGAINIGIHKDCQNFEYF